MAEKLGSFADPLLLIGCAAVIIFLIAVIEYAFIGIRDSLKIKIKKYRDRHKFDKPPKADCYCIACHLWLADDKERTMGRCEAWTGYHTSAEEFCSRGFKRSNDGYEHEKWRLGDS